MTSRRHLLIALGGSVLAEPAARAATVADGQLLDSNFFPDATVVQGQMLLLNGAGPAYAMGLKTINVGIYVARRHKTLDGLIAEKGPKRIDFFFLRDASARDTSNAMLDRMRQNITREEFGANIMALAQLGGAFGARKRFSRGDQISLDYSPGTQSTDFFLNHAKFGDTIPGETFYGMLLKVFVGPGVRERDALFGNATEP